MKKTLLIVALAAMLVFAFASSAFAAGINHSGQEALGAHGAPDANPEAVSTAAIYFGWKPALAGNVGSNSPHGNYTTTTVKCVVCHAVHYAAPVAAGGSVGTFTVDTGNQQADTLLRMKASEACIMCHATSGMAVNGRPVYDGIGPALIDNTGGAFDTGHFTGVNCSECHTNVHGANADNSVAALQGFLLKNMAATDVQNTSADTGNMIQAITAIDHNAENQGFAAGAALNGTIGDYATTNSATLREQAVGVFCAECHLGSYAAAAPGAATNVQGSGLASYSGHRIAAAASSGNTWNASGNISSGAVRGLNVAWAAATNCKSCHDANDTFGNTAFPHSWGGTKMWLTSAANAGAVKENLPYGTAAGSGYNEDAPQLSDGVCLKCHIASNGTEGVGLTF